MIRQNFEEVKTKLSTRGVPAEILTRFLTLDEKRRQLLVQSEDLKNTAMTFLQKSHN